MTDPMTDPTTPRPTDAAIALFRDALTGDGMYYLLNDYVHGADVTRADIARALLAHPTLARVIAIGQAWVARGEPEYEYDGPVYVRPVGRGIHLSEAPGKPYIDDVVDEGDYVMQVRIWPLAAALTDQERGS